MKRRDFLLLAGVMAMAWNPAGAEVKIPRIGFIHAGSRRENQRLLDAFTENLSALGWTDGNNVAVVDRWADEHTETLPAILKELIGSGVAVLVTAGTPATLAAKRASTTLPIILVAVDDPISLGLVESLGQPGGNATGLCLTSSEVITERLELLRELVPGLHRLAVIVRDDPGLDQLRDIRSDAQQWGIESAGIQTEGSERAFDLLMKARYLEAGHPGRGLVFATGTPISNTMVEMYTLKRYLAPALLEERGISHFDAWAASFGEVVHNMEISPDRSSLRSNARFSRFVNLPELQQMFRSFADVQTADMLKLPVPALRGGKAAVVSCPMSAEQIEIQAGLIARYERIRQGGVSPKGDNALAITTDGARSNETLRFDT